MLLTWAVGRAWEELDPELIRRSFRQCGISLNVDGSTDAELKIKNLPTATFAGWQRDVDTKYIDKREAVETAVVVPEALGEVNYVMAYQVPELGAELNS